MNLEIHRPELVERVNARIQTGQFHDADELIEKALDALDERAAARKAGTCRSGILARAVLSVAGTSITMSVDPGIPGSPW